MRFRVYSTLFSEDGRRDFDRLANHYPVLACLGLTKETVDKRLYRGGFKEVTVATIKIDSIEQLMALVRDSDKELVIGGTDEYGMPYIEIYDDYRE